MNVNTNPNPQLKQVRAT